MADYSGAIEMLQSDFGQHPNFIPSGLYLAASHSLAGNNSEAKATVAEILKVNPSYQLNHEFLRQFKNPENRGQFVTGLRQAGLLLQE